MNATWKLILGFVLILAVQGCCCFGNRWHETTCTTASNSPVSGTPTPPQVTMH